MLDRGLVLLRLIVARCAVPRDPEKTSERIAATHRLRVGISDNPPRTSTLAQELEGIEADLVRRFASQIGAGVNWTRGSEGTLAQALKHYRLDIAIGGFDAQTSWKSTAGVTQPFAKTADGRKHVLLAAPGENRFVLTLDTFLTERIPPSQYSFRSRY